MKSIACLLFLLGVVLSSAQTKTLPDTSTPEKTLQAFLVAMSSNDFDTMVSLVENAKNDSELRNNWNQSKEAFEGSDFQTIQSGSDAVVIYTLVIKRSGENYVAEDMVHLQLTPSGWKFASPKANVTTTRSGASMIAYALGNPEIVAGARRASEGAVCAQNIRQLALAMIMYAADYDDRMKVAPSQSEVRKALAPYLKSDRVWECPTGGKDCYTFNVKLAGVSFVEVDDPANTILFYEGHNFKLDFRHDGKAAVTFCDGHVKLVTEGESKSLNWSPTKGSHS